VNRLVIEIKCKSVVYIQVDQTNEPENLHGIKAGSEVRCRL
jgi:hypothetical protein